MKIDKENNILSPCVRNCCLNEKDICLGCFRHINEIIAWQTCHEEEKLAILSKSEKRKVDHQNTIG